MSLPVRPVRVSTRCFRYHDLRHYFASLLIADGADIKTVQTRLRHGSATTTLRTYTHLSPDKDESTRPTVERVLAARVDGVGERLANGEVIDYQSRRSEADSSLDVEELTWNRL